jgi:hypothetical protein
MSGISINVLDIFCNENITEVARSDHTFRVQFGPKRRVHVNALRLPFIIADMLISVQGRARERNLVTLQRVWALVSGEHERLEFE